MPSMAAVWRLLTLSVVVGGVESVVLRGSGTGVSDHITDSLAASRAAFALLANPAIDVLLGIDTSRKANLSQVLRHGLEVVDSKALRIHLLESLDGNTRSLVRSLVSRDAPDLDVVAVKKGLVTLNDMIAKAQTRLDEKTSECAAFETRNRMTASQVKQDLGRITSSIGNLKEREIGSRASISEAQSSFQKTTEQQRSAKVQYDSVLQDDLSTLAIQKADLKVAEYMLELTKCKEALFQVNAGSMVVEVCKNVDGTTNYTFNNTLLESSRSRLSARGAQLLNFALGRTQLRTGTFDVGSAQALWASGLIYGSGLEDLEDGTDDETEHKRMIAVSTLARVLPKEPVAPQKMSNRCAAAEPDCGLLHDTFSSLWGQMKDMVEELEDKISDDQKTWKDLNANFNAQLQRSTTEESLLAAQLTDAQAELGGEFQQQNAKESELKQLEEIYEKTMDECKSEMREILHTEICGTTSIRNQLITTNLNIPSSDIVDCVVTDWVEGECSMSCDDAMVGGSMVLTRDVMVGKTEYGAACPALNMTKKCGQFKCPVDCKLSDWEDYSACTAECGGGVQTRSRSVESKPENGGKPCSVLQETRSCNTGSCDRDCSLSDWTPYAPCTQACDGGFKSRTRSVLVPMRGDGRCWDDRSDRRYGTEQCNTQECKGDEECIASMDLVLAIDGSGSITEKGFELLRAFALNMLAKFRARAYGHQAMRVAVVQFGNGHLTSAEGVPGKVVSDAILALPLSGDFAQVESAIKALTFQRGFTNLAQAIMKCTDVLKKSNRSSVPGTAVIITDGKPSFKRSTRLAAERLRELGTLTIVHVKEHPSKEDVDMLKGFVSRPTETNYIHVAGKKALVTAMSDYATKALVMLCPSAMSPSEEAANDKKRGFVTMLTGKVCVAKAGLVMSALNAEGCPASANDFPWIEFAFDEMPKVKKIGGDCFYFDTPCEDYKERDGYTVYARLPPLAPTVTP